MKFTNEHQKAMYRLMDQWTCEIIGGYENVLEDYSKNDEEYQQAEKFLKQSHKTLVKYFYNMVMCDCIKGTNSEHARFAGTLFLLDIINARLTEWGY